MDRTLNSYEVGVFNKTVRDAIAVGEPVKALDKQWADVHWVKIRATSLERARAQAEAKYPAENGFVIVDIIEDKPDSKWG